MDQEDIKKCVDEAINSRRSVRAFLSTPIPRSTIEEILTLASRAPSGTNTQPWRVRVLTGQAKVGLSAAIKASYYHEAGALKDAPEYDYYPRTWFSPYVDRRRKIGFDLYGLLNIKKDEKQRMIEQMGKNFDFFGAPVGLIFTIDRNLGQGSWLDYGFFLQNIAISARARGLHTCPQAAFADFPQTIGTHLQFDAEEMLVCGMSLGFEDVAAPENQLQTQREPVSAFTQFLED